MRIVVTGRGGQVGDALQASLAGLGEVIALDRAQLDLANADAIRTALRELQPAVVINAAAYTAVDAAEADLAMAFGINADAPRVLAEPTTFRFTGYSALFNETPDFGRLSKTVASLPTTNRPPKVL